MRLRFGANQSSKQWAFRFIPTVLAVLVIHAGSFLFTLIPSSRVGNAGESAPGILPCMSTEAMPLVPFNISAPTKATCPFSGSNS